MVLTHDKRVQAEGGGMSNKSGDLRVWWMPQIPMDPFYVSVSSVSEGAKILDVLADYDLFQYETSVKPDYANAGGLAEFDGEGWCDWYDDETGEDNPIAYVESLLTNKEGGE